jgi:hypothetical protein
MYLEKFSGLGHLDSGNQESTTPDKIFNLPAPAPFLSPVVTLNVSER